MSKARSNKPSRPRCGQSEVLTKKQFAIVLTTVAFVILLLAILSWRGYPIGNTIMPVLIGLAFLTGIYFTIKSGTFRWKGGATIRRNEQPFQFWFWTAVFGLVGLFALGVGLLEFLKRFLLR